MTQNAKERIGGSTRCRVCKRAVRSRSIKLCTECRQKAQPWAYRVEWASVPLGRPKV